jgi:hypothetical protein
MDQLIQNQSKQPLAAPTVSYTQSLRAIGQALEALRLRSFELRKNATDYMLRVRISASAGKVKTISAKLSVDVEHFKKQASDFEIPITNFVMARLDAEGRSRRGKTVGPPTANFSLSLRVLGNFLDEKRAVTFLISWSPHSVVVQYQTPNGTHRVRDFTTKNLYDRAVHKLGIRMYLRRSWQK